MVVLEHREDVQPLCPYCEKELAKVFMNEIRGFLGKRYLYFCPHCRKTLGVTHRKGFFMG